MSKRDWRTPTVFGLTGLLIFCSFFYAVWHTGYSQAEKRMSRQQDAEHHIKYAEDRIDETCTQADRSSILKCVHDEIKSAQDHGRAKSDLDAQMAMALWAKIMTLSGIAGSILAGGGLYLVWRTLETTGDAVDAANTANKIMRDEQRPWLKVEPGGYFGPSEPDAEGYLSFILDYKVLNVGKSPGFNFSVCIETHSYDSKDELRKIAKGQIDGTWVPEDAGTNSVIFPEEEIPVESKPYCNMIPLQPKAKIALMVILVYAQRQNFDPKQRSSTLGADIRCYQIKGEKVRGVDVVGAKLSEISSIRTVK